MPRYKPVHKGLKLLPVDFDKQIQPGSFEFALCYLIDHELDLSAFHARYRNDYEEPKRRTKAKNQSEEPKRRTKAKNQRGQSHLTF